MPDRRRTGAPALNDMRRQASVEDLQKLNRPPLSVLGPDGLPKVKPPPMFRPGPIVTGTELAKDVEDLLRIAPELRGNIREVTSAPTAAAIRSMLVEGEDPTDLQHSKLNGQYDYGGHVYVRPDEYRQPGSSTLRGTLAHEAAHSRGYMHESGVPQEMQRAFERLDFIPKSKDINLPLKGSVYDPEVRRGPRYTEVHDPKALITGRATAKRPRPK